MFRLYIDMRLQFYRLTLFHTFFWPFYTMPDFFILSLYNLLLTVWVHLVLLSISRRNAEKSEKIKQILWSFFSLHKAPLMPLLKYLENDLVVEKGKENMKWFRLRKEELRGISIRCVAMCCYSTLAVHHPFYKVNNLSISLLKPSSLFFLGLGADRC